MNKPNPNQQQININPNDTTGIECAKCKCQIFQECFMMRRLSAIMSPDGKEQTFTIPVPVCIACGTPYTGDQKVDGLVPDINKEEE